MISFFPYQKTEQLLTKLQNSFTMNTGEEHPRGYYPDQEVSFFDSYSLVKTGIYFSLLAKINHVAPHLPRYRVVGLILQMAMQTLPTFLYLYNMSGEGIKHLVYNFVPYKLRPYKISLAVYSL